MAAVLDGAMNQRSDDVEENAVADLVAHTRLSTQFMLDALSSELWVRSSGCEEYLNHLASEMLEWVARAAMLCFDWADNYLRKPHPPLHLYGVFF